METDFRYALRLMLNAEARQWGLPLVPQTALAEQREQACPWQREGRD